jgi:hypothetical protein
MDAARTLASADARENAARRASGNAVAVATTDENFARPDFL